MVDHHINFQGYAQIYLEGNDALFFSSTLPGGIEFRLASAGSHIFVRDFRTDTRDVLKSLIGLPDNGEFARVFNRPGLVRVVSSSSQVEIEISEGRLITGMPTLWLGVIEDGRMAAFDLGWETYEQVGENRIAFAAIIKGNSPQNSFAVPLTADEPENHR